MLAGIVGSPLLAKVAAANPITEFLGRMVSPEEERQLGRQAFAELKRKTPVSRNRELQARLLRVGERIVPASGAAVPLREWEFVVFRSNEVNAFALPGGKVGFYEGIFPLFKDDAQLATVLGHEVGHVNARHTAQRIGAQTASELGESLLARLFGLEQGSGVDQLLAGLMGAGVEFGVLLPYSRAQESEADHLGLEYMAKAGYDPDEALTFWRKMMAASRGSPPAFLSNHPSDEQRIAAIEAELPAVEAVYKEHGGDGATGAGAPRRGG